jgi:DNA adenine methylase
MKRRKIEEIAGRVQLKAPFPFFGAKSRVASVIWNRLGSRDSDCYIEPCCGSAAVFLARPQPIRGREVLNDYDCLLVNTWRSIKRDPDKVADICCGILRAESELHAIHSYLTRIRDEIRPRIERDPDFCDVKLGAWWLWGVCMKLGGGWCSGEGPWHSVDGMLVNAGEADGKGITRSVPCVGNRGVLRQNIDDLKAWMQALSYRLKDTLILNGDWSQAVTPTMMGSGIAAVFLDPPYGAEADYNSTLYTSQDASISTKIKEWCIANGTKPNLRIAYCGYAPEGDVLERHGWSVHRWSAQGGYGNQGQANREKVLDGGQSRLGNRHRECVWFGPACRPVRRLMED